MSSTADTSPRQRRSLGLTGDTQARELPSTARGIRTRGKLIQAARVVFERDGYLDARLIDITTEAGVSAGTFYTYFDGKEEIFAAVLAEVGEEMLHPEVHGMVDGDDAVAVIRASNRAYLEMYRKHAKFMQLLHEVSSIDERFRVLRRKRAQAFVERNARSIQELQDRGMATSDVDARLASSILSGMVSRAAYSKFVVGEDWDFDTLVDTVTQLWVNALKIAASRPS